MASESARLRVVGLVPCSFRHVTDADLALIRSSWMRSLRESQTHRDVEASVYKTNQPLIINGLIRRSLTIMAVNPEDPTQIFGYVVATPTTSNVCVLHWLYVKSAFRKLGIGSALVREAIHETEANTNYPVCCTYISHNFNWLKDKLNLVYNPYLVAMENADDPN